MALATLAAALVAAPGSALATVLTATNGVYTVGVEDGSAGGNPNGNLNRGRYAASTAAGHPIGGGFGLLYGIGAPQTTFNTIHSFTTGTDYVQGSPGQTSPPSVISLSPLMAVTPLGSNGVRALRTMNAPDKITVETDTVVGGTTPSDSVIEVTTHVTNDDNAPVRVGIRYLWDVQVGGDDGPMFQPVGTGAPFSTNEAAFAAPAFASWRVEDNGHNFSPPTYDVLGSAAGPVAVGPAPTPPSLLEFGCFPAASHQPFAYTADPSYDVSTSQSLCGGLGANGDSGVLLYWGDQSANAIAIDPGHTATVTALLAAAPTGGAFSDRAAPASELSAPGCTQSGELSFRVTDADGGTGPASIHTRMDGGAEQVSETAGNPGVAAVTLPEGPHTIEYWGEDSSGNQEPAHHTATVVVDHTRPTVSITSDQGTTHYLKGALASVTTAAADAGSGLGTDPSGGRERIPTDRTGEQIVSRTARDACGNLQTTTFSYTVSAVVARDFFALDSARECTGKRRLAIRLRQPGGERIASLRVFLNGRLVRRFSGSSLRPTVRITKVSRSRTTVVLQATTQSGTSFTFSRTYAKCAKKKKRAKAHLFG